MTLDQAIERTQKIIKTGRLGFTPTAYQALLLGIEALKLIKEMREFYYWGPPALLPGEAEE